MKNLRNYKHIGLMMLVLSIFLASACKKNILNITPPTSITPTNYLVEETQLGAYAINQYPGILPSHTGVGQYTFGTFSIDQVTDNQIGLTQDNRYSKALLLVPTGLDNNWNFSTIYSCNY